MADIHAVRWESSEFRDHKVIDNCNRIYNGQKQEELIRYGTKISSGPIVVTAPIPSPLLFGFGKHIKTSAHVRSRDGALWVLITFKKAVLLLITK